MRFVVRLHVGFPPVLPNVLSHQPPLIRKRKRQRLLDRTNKIPEQNRNICNPKQRIHCGNLPDQCLIENWEKHWVSTDWVNTTWQWKKADTDRPAAQRGEVVFLLWNREQHFLTHCNQYQSITDQYFAKIIKIFPEFLYLSVCSHANKANWIEMNWIDQTSAPNHPGVHKKLDI